MKFPWTPKLETRDGSFTDAFISALVNRATNEPTPLPTATGALESAAGLIGRSFAAAEVEARPAVIALLTPDTLETIGRSLIRDGQSVWLIHTVNDALQLLPAQTFDVSGGSNPDGWEYQITVGGPSHTETFYGIPAESVLHFRYAVDPGRPWMGNSPLSVAHLAGRLSAETVAALGDESAGPRGQILGLPVDGSDPTVVELKRDIARARGRMAYIETGDWNAGGTGHVNIKAERFGANPGEYLVTLAELSTREVLAACGVNAAVFASADAASAREAYRMLLFSTIAPLGKKVSAELTKRFEDDVILDWTELRASDLQGRARSFKALVDGGLSVESAGLETGLKNRTPAPTPPAPAPDANQRPIDGV